MNFYILCAIFNLLIPKLYEYKLSYKNIRKFVFEFYMTIRWD